MKKLLVIFLALAANVTVAQESVKLRLNYTKDDTYKAVMTMSQDMGLMMSMSMNIDTSIKITDVNDDTYTSEMKFTKMTMNMLQGGQAMTYDSSKSDDELDEGGKMMKTQMAPMLSAVITSKGNNLGEVLETKAEPNVPGIENMTKQSSNVVYPKEAVKVGSTWSIKKDEKGMNMEFIYEVKSISKESVDLILSGKVTGMAAGDIKGSMKIDRATGVPLDSLIDMTLDIQGQEMKSTVTMKMSKE